MELRVLRYFLAIAREENMTKAASVLHLTQPTLSRQIHQLEQELGTTLFIRNGHHIFLTASVCALNSEPRTWWNWLTERKRK